MGKALTDEELGKITGGYHETNGYASGYMIRCPKCGASAAGDFQRNDVDALGQACYVCKCGQVFLLDSGGFGTMLNNTPGQFNADPVRLH